MTALARAIEHRQRHCRLPHLHCLICIALERRRGSAEGFARGGIQLCKQLSIHLTEMKTALVGVRQGEALYQEFRELADTLPRVEERVTQAHGFRDLPL